MQIDPRKHPAHPAPHFRHNEPVIVQVNVCTKGRRPVLACEDTHRLFRAVWQQADFWRVGSYIIMPDHIHLFCAPGRIPATSLRQWVAYWKSRVASNWPLAIDAGDQAATASTLEGPAPSGPIRNGTEPDPPGMRVTVGTEPAPPGGKLWQRDYWDTQMRSREHYEEKLYYVRMNAVRKGLVKSLNEWPYQGEICKLTWL